VIGAVAIGGCVGDNLQLADIFFEGFAAVFGEAADG
jgi:hypothetical protein